MSKVLVIDDEEAIRDAVAYSLRAEGLDVECREDGLSAVAAVTENAFDLVVLDVMLPDLSGVEVARRVRAASDVPILMLTARSSETDLVLGFEAGADDYVAKPFSMRELVSRARAILRRRELDRSGLEQVRQAGDVELDLLRHETTVAGARTLLTPTEFRILELLSRDDRAYTRREILQAAWETTFIPDERSCDVHIANLRRKLEREPSQPTRVVTVRGVGYRLVRP
ncbi:MAG TPA: response regulator transcription factor [Gaiellaceae bacterium]|nr:response regulator transcription factor [Gaiellaceae bacterium]